MNTEDNDRLNSHSGKGLKHFDSYSYNPFRINSEVIRKRVSEEILNKRIEVVNGIKTEIRVFGDSSVEYMDMQDHIRLYKDIFDIIPKLSSAGMKVLYYIFCDLPKGSDEVCLNVPLVAEKTGFTNRMSVYNGIIELLEKKVLAKKAKRGMYYVNPAMLFRGKRIVWFNKMTGFDKDNEGIPKIFPESMQLKTKKRK